MKTLIKIMLLTTGLLFVVGVCAQVTSNNKEFSYNYVSKYALVTGLGDTIYTNHLMPHGISDEGHPYAIQTYHGEKITVYYSGPWIQENALFIEFNKRGQFVQSLMFFKGPGQEQITFSYLSGDRSVSNEIHNNYSKALSLWKTTN